VDILVTKQTKPLFNAVLNADGFVEDQFSELAYQVMFEDWYGRNVSINYMQNGNMAYAACGETQFIVEKYEVFVPMTNVELAADAD
jgi:hypothetical protein